ncbi:hypothetical protein [Curtobacterium oceanosedimentum]|uniref:hypothetical protein n=1 Tax=Curtobacterium oceanosedimentum TaxID=465820 RepID=UPI00128EF59E|nr:hypothetical protein [Curtobacterium oceanosedimentum]
MLRNDQEKACAVVLLVSGDAVRTVGGEVMEMALWIGLAAAGVGVLGVVSAAVALVAVAAEAEREGLPDAD